MPYSDCCGAYTDMEEIGICPECKEHCEFEWEEDNEPEPFTTIDKVVSATLAIGITLILILC